MNFGRIKSEQASAAVEHVAVTTLLLVVLTGVFFHFKDSGSGKSIGATTGGQIEKLVTDPTRRSTKSLEVNKRSIKPVFNGVSSTDASLRASAVPSSIKFSDNSLRLRPISPRKVKSGKVHKSSHRLGNNTQVEAQLASCILCSEFGVRFNNRSGLTKEKSSATRGTHLEVTAEGRAALASNEFLGSLKSRTPFGGELGAETRFRSSVGAEVEGKAKLRLQKDKQELDLKGSALAGAAAKAEAKVGMKLLGIALSQRGSMELWAGAGARGEIKVKRTTSGLDWRIGGGAAMGVGAAADWSGSIDVSGIPERYVRVGSAALRQAIRATRPELTVIQTNRRWRSLRKDKP